MHGWKGGLLLENVVVGDLDETDVLGLDCFTGGEELQALFAVQKKKELSLQNENAQQCEQIKQLKDEQIRDKETVQNNFDQMRAQWLAEKEQMEEDLRAFRQKEEKERNSWIDVGMTDDHTSGILKKLSQECCQNAIEAGAVVVTAASPHGGGTGQYAYSKLLDWSIKDFYHIGSVAGKIGDYVQFDFKRRRIKLSTYAIMSMYSNQPLSWSIEGSNSAPSGYTKLDERLNRQDLNAGYKVHTFHCQQISEPYQYIRIVCQGPGSDSALYMLMAHIEFFGSLSRN